MIDLVILFEYFIIAFVTGGTGAILGIGGGIIIVPILTLIFNIPIHYAIGASITAVVATSSISSSIYVKEGLSNTRLGMFLELGTALGALVGAIITTYLASSNTLFIIFAIVLMYAAYSMITSAQRSMDSQLAVKNDKLAEFFKLEGSYFDQKTNREISYFIDRTLYMLGISFGAGIASGLLGVGGGFIKVPALVKIGKIPMKAASATSNFMIGITASTSALIYFFSSYIDPYIAAPLTIGSLIGSLVGTKLFNFLDAKILKILFGGLLILISIELFLRGFQITTIS